ncbi:hypothetical protein [Streptomyces sp. rh34]|uniref:hypothetical protein n=1 Tax=Streptomyces sp. rh34 TaxID=2034272 RepID=UPI000BF159EB|nr:hypothetical protein [Streptomyces sp. rh34]
MTDTTPTPADRPADGRTTWPTAEPLQQAADLRRAAGDPLLADWLDATANALAWLAPYRDNEPGYGMWEAALAVARQLLGTTEGGDGRCPVMTPGGRCEKDADHRAGRWPDDPHVPAAPPAPADRAATCICGHPEQQHFEDACQACDCGDYIEPQDARQVIARWRQAALANRDLRRATTLREGAGLIEQALIHSVTPAASERDETWDQAVRAAAAELRDVAGEAAAGEQQPTTADRATALGMTPTEYRQNSHTTAVHQIRDAAKGLFAGTALRVMDALATTPAAPAAPEEPTR